MNFLALHDDVKFIIANLLASDLKIRTMLSKNHDIQKILFGGDVVYNDDLNHYINLQYNAKDNDDFKSAKIFKIYQDLSYTRDVVYIGSTCDALSKCMSNFRIKSKSRVNWSHAKFYMMTHQTYINCKIELIKDFPCNTYVCMYVCMYMLYSFFHTYMHTYIILNCTELHTNFTWKLA
jgi:hypothetical protein